ncbi:MAG: isochorismate family cysteine hydrolase YcaC [Pleurocapsa sp.]
MTQTTTSKSTYLVKLTPDNSVLVMVDYLTGFLSAIKTIDSNAFQNNVTALAKIGNIFQLPTIILGDEGGFRGEFMPQMEKYLSHGQHIERHTPSGYGAPAFVAALEKIDRPKVIMAGISTDNCVTQTTLDLLKAGYEVYIVIDASGTDSKLVEDAAIARMIQAGAVITNWGCIASELMGDWQSSEGEKIGALYQEHSQWGRN